MQDFHCSLISTPYLPAYFPSLPIFCWSSSVYLLARPFLRCFGTRLSVDAGFSLFLDIDPVLASVFPLAPNLLLVQFGLSACATISQVLWNSLERRCRIFIVP